MATIVSSSFAVGHKQADGRRYVNESHVVDDGQLFVFEYLCDDVANPDTVMALRASQLQVGLSVIAASAAIVGATSVPVSYAYFRKLFTAEEMQGIDKVDDNLDSFGFTPRQIDEQRSMLKQIAVSGQVFLAAPATRVMLNLYVIAGVLTAERLEEVLAALDANAVEQPKG
jgi:hypothetical protein